MSVYKKEAKKAKNGYTYQVNFQYVNKYGIKKRYIKSGFKTKKEATIHENTKKEEIKNGIHISENKTFDKVFNEYIQSLNLRESTLNNRLSIYNRNIKPAFGNMKMNYIDFDFIQNFLNAQGKIYSKNTCKIMKSIINLVMCYAYNMSYITRMPYSKLKVTGIEKEKQKTITIEQFNCLINALSHPKAFQKIRYDSYIVLLYIGLYTGIRIGEALALNRDDIDLRNKTMTINKQFHKNIENYTKTKTSTAIIPMPEELAKILKNHFKKYPNTNLVCFNQDYNYIRYKSAIDKFSDIGKENGFHFHYHMLRHTFVTQLYRKNINVKTAQTLARHSSIKTTLDIYTNLENEDLSGITNNLYN